MDLTQKAKIKDEFLILSIQNGKLTPFGKVEINFLCPNCDTPNKYELRFNVGPDFLDEEKKCKACGTEYNPRLEIELKGYVRMWT